MTLILELLDVLQIAFIWISLSIMDFITETFSIKNLGSLFAEPNGASLLISKKNLHLKHSRIKQYLYKDFFLSRRRNHFY